MKIINYDRDEATPDPKKAETAPVDDSGGKNTPAENEVTVKFVGPLSEIYTKALLKLMSGKEAKTEGQLMAQESQQMSSFIAASQIINDAELNKPEQVNPSDPPVYAYVTDTNQLVDREDMLDAIGEIARLRKDNQDAEIVAVIETPDVVTLGQASLESYLEADGIKVYHSRSGALTALRTRLIIQKVLPKS